MITLSLIGSATLLLASPEATDQPPAGPPAWIVLPVIQPGCDRFDDVDATVCGRSDRRYRIDPATLGTLRAIETRDDQGNRPRPDAITRGCTGMGAMVSCTGNLPISDMALRGIRLLIKAVHGDNLLPELRQGLTDYELYQRAQAEAEERKKK